MTYNPDDSTGHDELAAIADHAYDDFDEAMTERPKRYFGQVTYLAPVRVTIMQGRISGDTFIREGNKWPRTYNDPHAWAIAEAIDKEARSQRKPGEKIDTGIFNVKEIEVNITPLDPRFTIIERHWGINQPGWQQVIRPSLKALEGRIATVKDLVPGQFNILSELVELFVEYENILDPGNKPGKTYTVPRFLNVYAVREECQAAADAYFNGGNTGNEADEVPAESDEDATKSSLAPFLKALWEEAGNDAGKMKELLEGNPLLSPVFTMESEEVLALIKG